MFRRNRGILHPTLRLMFLVTIACVGGALRGDDVADYLDKHGLKFVLATHLEQQIDQAKEDERGELVLRLSSLLAELLESTVDPARRQAIEQRSRSLLEKAPANSAEELRMALLRNTYRIAEKIAENHRLRLSSAEELEAAKKSLSEITPQIATLRQRLKHQWEITDRRLSRASGLQAMALGDAGDRTLALLAQCTFLHAWALYYQSWLSGTDAEARVAEPLFAELLSTESPSPQPTDVSVDLRSNEAIARCILGMALCKSITTSHATAVSWLRLLEHENAFEPLRTQATAWRIAVYLDHRQFQQVRDLLDEHEGEVPLVWLRLVAVHALEHANASRIAEDLARHSVLQLAVRGELTQVMDLANRYGPEALGRSGFALQYVHGVTQYQKARAAHGNDTPTMDTAIGELYSRAAQQLEAALAERDAASQPQAAAACKRLIAWCMYFQCRYLEARDAFEQAAATLSGNEAAEALWMAIVALDKVVEGSGDLALRSQLDELSLRFINLYPSSEQAARLRLRRVVATTDVSEEAINELLAIPPGSEVFDSAQRRAAEMLYQLFRAAPANERIFHANRYLSIALPLLTPSSRTIDLTDTTGAGLDRFVVRCRQVLEVALADEVSRPDAARAALTALDELQREGVDLSGFADEIDCRRVQERLASEDDAEAATVANQMWARDSNSLWARLATRALFKHGHQKWKNADAPPQERLLGLELVARFGGRVLHEFKDVENAINMPGAMGYYVAVAEASMEMWQQTGDAEKGKGALFLFEQLLAARPRSAPFLRGVALLSEKVGDRARALECWRKLVAGSASGTEAWYEAKFHLINLLAASDPARARQVMDQHKQLNPDYGPDPWGGMLKGLDEQIPKAIVPAEKPPSNDES
jgi:hypothetical protein